MEMLLTFATAAEVDADFISVLVWGAIVVVVTIIVLAAATKESPSAVSTSSAVKIGCFAFLLLAIVSYRASYGSFIAADIGADEARLSFAGSLYHPVILKREQIGEVLFGYPGKGEAKSCYLEFVTTSGEHYRSATTAGKACQDYRAQIKALMKL